MAHTLEADSIQLEFNGRKILSSVYIRCEVGKITGLLGKNGQGKSCLMKAVYGSFDCQKSVRFDNSVLFSKYSPPEFLQFLPQFNFIPKSLSIRRIFKDYNLPLPAFLDIFPQFALKLDLPVKHISGGDQRLVEIYVIVKSNARFAMLDEPFTHLSPLQIEKVKSLLVQEKENKGFLITDHMFRDVIDISDSIYVLSNGKTHLTQGMDDIAALGYAKF